MQVEEGPSDHAVPPTCHQSQPTDPPGALMTFSIRGMATMIAGLSTIVNKSQTKEGI